MKKPMEIALEVVAGLSFSSNRMVNGRLVGEQHFAAQAIASAIEQERERYDTVRSALCDAIIALNGVKTGRLTADGRKVCEAVMHGHNALETAGA